MSQKLSIRKASTVEIYPKKLKQLMIEQIKKDQENLFKIKEVIFVGRSNVGKTSLLNNLFKTKLGTESKKPVSANRKRSLRG